MMEELISIVSIIFSALAAIFWLLSALVHTPGKTKIGMGEIQKSMKRQSILNAITAFQLALSRFFNLLHIYHLICIKNHKPLALWDMQNDWRSGWCETKFSIAKKRVVVIG